MRYEDRSTITHRVRWPGAEVTSSDGKWRCDDPIAMATFLRHLAHMVDVLAEEVRGRGKMTIRVGPSKGGGSTQPAFITVDTYEAKEAIP